MPERDSNQSDGDPSPSPAPEDRSDPEDAVRNPGAGCIIMSVAVISLCFLVGFGIWNLFKLDRELAKFTETIPHPTPVPDLVENAAAVNVLTSKLETFKTDQGNQRSATLTLTPKEINLALAIFEEFEELRQTFSVRSIEGGQLHIAISFPLRGSPTKGGFRYLNGTMVATPELAGGEIHLVIDRLEIPGKKVPDGFVGQLSPYRLTERYVDDETLGPWMARLTDLAVGEGSISFVINPGETPPASAPPKLETRHLVRLGILFGGILLAFLALLCFAAKRGKRIRTN